MWQLELNISQAAGLLLANKVKRRDRNLPSSKTGQLPNRLKNHVAWEYKKTAWNNYIRRSSKEAYRVTMTHCTYGDISLIQVSPEKALPRCVQHSNLVISEITPFIIMNLTTDTNTSTSSHTQTHTPTHMHALTHSHTHEHTNTRMHTPHHTKHTRARTQRPNTLITI